MVITLFCVAGGVLVASGVKPNPKREITPWIKETTLVREIAAIVMAMVGSILVANVIISEFIPRIPLTGPVASFLIGVIFITMALLIRGVGRR